jgi:hypothetical protein
MLEKTREKGLSGPLPAGPTYNNLFRPDPELNKNDAAPQH